MVSVMTACRKPHQDCALRFNVDEADFVSAHLRSSFLVACGIAVTAALVLGSVAMSNAGTVAAGPSHARIQEAASATAATSSDDEAGPRPAPLVVASAPASFGSRMVDGRGVTLYVFSLDTPRISRCAGACTREWLPVRSSGGKAQSEAGMRAANVGSMQRPDGSDQITFNGRPLYFYSGDKKSGDSAGHGRRAYGGQWSAVPPTKP